jgi:hypothetical protein
LTSQQTTGSLSEHVAKIQAALEAAREDGYLLQGWTDGYHNDSVGVDLMLIRNKRGDDGVMRNEERALIGKVWT